MGRLSASAPATAAAAAATATIAAATTTAAAAAAAAATRKVWGLLFVAGASLEKIKERFKRRRFLRPSKP